VRTERCDQHTTALPDHHLCKREGGGRAKIVSVVGCRTLVRMSGQRSEGGVRGGVRVAAAKLTAVQARQGPPSPSWGSINGFVKSHLWVAEGRLGSSSGGTQMLCWTRWTLTLEHGSMGGLHAPSFHMHAMCNKAVRPRLPTCTCISSRGLNVHAPRTAGRGYDWAMIFGLCDRKHDPDNLAQSYSRPAGCKRAQPTR